MSNRRGFALVAVLWALVLTAVLAAELHTGVRADQRVTANARASARARWAARAGLARVSEALRSRLAVSSATGALVLSDTDTLVVPAQDFELDRVRVRATAVDARSKLNLNTATPDELRALFQAVGYNQEDADRLALAVERWRTEHLPAFEAAPADSAAERIRPPRGAFAAVEELRGVPGVSRAAYASATPFLTVSSDGRINLNTAPVPVLRTLPGIDDEGARALVERRRRGSPFLSPYEVVDALPRALREAAQARLDELTARTAFVPREAEVRVVARQPGAAIGSTIRAVAVMPGGPRLPVLGVVER
jgi:general secretion pathway protein K